MKKFIADMHTHSYPASHDGLNTLPEMLAAAHSKGVEFYGVSNHFDYEYDISKMSEEEYNSTRNGNEEEYFHTARHLQEDYEGVMNVAVGAEFGFGEDKDVQEMYLATYEKYRPDYVINSIHSEGGVDLSRRNYTESREETIRMYFDLVKASLDAIYPYDIVGHFGYVCRYLPFEDNDLRLEEFGEEIDDVLKTIIKKDKILELNTATKTLPWLSIPNMPIVRRYYELGGRKVCFGSDAHNTERILDKWDEVIATLKEIGFTYLTIPFKGEHIKLEI